MVERFRAGSIGIFIAALGCAAGAAPPAKEQADVPALNAKVVEFARAQRGKKVGDGSCLTLAVKALEHAGAVRYPLSRADGDYVWGRQIEQFRDALPGDVLQFRDAEFKGKQRLPRGRWVSWHHRYPHHTAIVAGVSQKGKLVTVLHQNVGLDDADDASKKVVQEGTIRTDSLQKGGWVRIYRPIRPDEVEFLEPAERP